MADRKQTDVKVPLSDPWYTLQRELANTIGCDSAVTVGEIDTTKIPFVIPVIVDDEQKGKSLSTVLLHEKFAGQQVDIKVQNSSGTVWPVIDIISAKQLADVVTAAFTGNPLFVKAMVAETFFGLSVGLIMTKSVVQFFNDDMSDFYQNYNRVTAQVIADLIRMEYSGVYIVLGTSKD